MELSYFVLGVIAYQIGKMLVLAIGHEIKEHRARKFIKLVNVTFPDHKAVTFISVDGTDKKSLADLEAQLREQFNEPKRGKLVPIPRAAQQYDPPEAS